MVRRAARLRELGLSLAAVGIVLAEDFGLEAVSADSVRYAMRRHAPHMVGVVSTGRLSKDCSANLGDRLHS